MPPPLSSYKRGILYCKFEGVSANMGMFDIILHTMKCPKCGEKFTFSEQVKWTNDCAMMVYKIGDYIDAKDGEYDFATWARLLITKCDHCGEKIKYNIVVRDGILSEINPETETKQRF